MASTYFISISLQPAFMLFVLQSMSSNIYYLDIYAREVGYSSRHETDRANGVNVLYLVRITKLPSSIRYIIHTPAAVMCEFCLFCVPTVPGLYQCFSLPISLFEFPDYLVKFNTLSYFQVESFCLHMTYLNPLSIFILGFLCLLFFSLCS